jgi:hypothetical protein
MISPEAPPNPPQRDRSRTNKTPIQITLQPDGRPEIPSVTEDDSYDAKALQSMLREYCTTHIRESPTQII